ncbi:hypothetical protein ACFWOX_24425 [Streptomyces sp. NPDC058467]|uniref:hypothetical protein n=1 Tax=Streptomyces sp. NPDC058467 TaxID=3346513 RepID=UPI00364839AD
MIGLVSGWSAVVIVTRDRLPAGDLGVGQDEQGAQQLGGVPGVHPCFVRILQFFRSAKPCSLAARSRLTSLFASFSAAVSGRLRARRSR